MAGSPKRPAKVPPAATTNVSGAAPKGAAAARAVFDVLRRLERFRRWGDDDGGATDWEATLLWPSSSYDAEELLNTSGYVWWEEDGEGNFRASLHDKLELREDDDLLRLAICENAELWVGVEARMAAGWGFVRHLPQADRLDFLLQSFPRLNRALRSTRVIRSKAYSRKAVVRQALQEQMPKDLRREAEEFVWQCNGDGRRIRAIEGDEWLDVLTVDQALDELRQALLNHASPLAQQHPADNQVAQPADNESESGWLIDPIINEATRVVRNADGDAGAVRALATDEWLDDRVVGRAIAALRHALPTAPQQDIEAKANTTNAKPSVPQPAQEFTTKDYKTAIEKGCDLGGEMEPRMAQLLAYLRSKQGLASAAFCESNVSVDGKQITRKMWRDLIADAKKDKLVDYPGGQGAKVRILPAGTEELKRLDKVLAAWMAGQQAKQGQAGPVKGQAGT